MHVHLATPMINLPYYTAVVLIHVQADMHASEKKAFISLLLALNNLGLSIFCCFPMNVYCSARNKCMILMRKMRVAGRSHYKMSQKFQQRIFSPIGACPY